MGKMDAYPCKLEKRSLEKSQFLWREDQQHAGQPCQREMH